MPHQGDTAALRGAVEEGNFRAVFLKRISVDHGRRVCVGMDTISIAWLVCNHSCAIAIDTNLVAVDDLQARLVSPAEVPAFVNGELYKTIGIRRLTLELSLPLHLLVHLLPCTWVHPEYRCFACQN